MKIICIGKNYVTNVAEKEALRQADPVIFTKPESALLREVDPFYIPDWSDNVFYEAEILVKINHNGKNIKPEFAHKYYDEVGLGFDFTAKDMLNKLREKKSPWDLAKGFNGAAPVCPKFINKEELNLEKLQFSMNVNGEEKQNSDTSFMIWSIDEIVAYVSQFFMLKKGDIIFTGTPAGAGKMEIGDVLEGFIEGKKMLTVKVK